MSLQSMGFAQAGPVSRRENSTIPNTELVTARPGFDLSLTDPGYNNRAQRHDPGDTRG
jgi:hypothetical protein